MTSSTITSLRTGVQLIDEIQIATTFYRQWLLIGRQRSHCLAVISSLHMQLRSFQAAWTRQRKPQSACGRSLKTTVRRACVVSMRKAHPGPLRLGTPARSRRCQFGCLQGEEIASRGQSLGLVPFVHNHPPQSLRAEQPCSDYVSGWIPMQCGADQ